MVLHIFVGQKIMILGNRPDFLTFLAKKLPNVYVVVCKKGPPIWLSTRMSIVQGCQRIFGPILTLVVNTAWIVKCL